MKQVAGQPRSDPHHRRRLDRRGGPRQGGGRERRLAGAVADGDQAGPARGDGHHRRHAVDRAARQSRRKLCHIRPCGAADRAGARRQSAGAAVADSGARGVHLQEEARPPRICSRRRCGAAEDGTLEAVKFPREGAGLLSSLVETDGLIELGEDITRVEPGESVGFLSYADLL